MRYSRSLVALSQGWPYRPTPDEMEALEITEEMAMGSQFAKSIGCPECRGTGYKGRIGIYEVILGTTEFKSALAKGVSAIELLEVARKQGFTTLMEDGRDKVLKGWTTPEEVIRAVFTEAMD